MCDLFMVTLSCCALYCWSPGPSVSNIDGHLVLLCTLLMVTWSWWVLYWWTYFLAVYSIDCHLVLLCILLMVTLSCCVLYWMVRLSWCVLYWWSPGLCVHSIDGPAVYSIDGHLVLMCTLLMVTLFFSNCYTRLENLAWSHSVFWQFSFCRIHRFMKPLLLSSVDTFCSFT